MAKVQVMLVYSNICVVRETRRLFVVCYLQCLSVLFHLSPGPLLQLLQQLLLALQLLLQLLTLRQQLRDASF